MLYRDVTTISSDNNTCNVINTNDIIYGYSNQNRTRKKYVLIQDKYILSETTTNSYGYSVDTYNCINNQVLNALPSEANYYTPFYGCVAFALSVFVLYLVWFSVRSILGRKA